MSEGTEKTSRRGTELETGAPERVTLAVSVLLLVALVATLLVVRFTNGDAEASIKVTPDWGGAFERDGSWYLPLELENTGDRPTDTVRVDVVREVSGEEPEVADLEFDFVAGGENVEGWAALDARPTPDTVTVDVVSITDP